MSESYVVCEKCGYKIPLSDIYGNKIPKLFQLTCPNCGEKYFYLYISPQDFHTIRYLISLLTASYMAPLIYPLMKSINEEAVTQGREA